MLEFLRLTICNFGPYKDEQVIDFKDGVTIIWGDNGRGKTTLLNAFRYALYGNIYQRSSRKKNLLRTLCNLENSEKGIFSFSVVLRMRFDGEVYDLCRQFKLRPELSEPRSDADFIEETSLKKGSSYLSSKQQDHYLNKIMPEQISRFFLFDGELLSEYEDLMDNGREIGLTIKNSIEKILGVPILTNGFTDIKHALGEINKEYASIAKKDEKNRAFVNALEAARIKLDQENNELASYKAEKQRLSQEKADLEEQLKKTEKIRVLIERKRFLHSTIEANLRKQEESISELKKHAKNSWLYILSDKIKGNLNDIYLELKALESKKSKAIKIKEDVYRLEKALHSSICPTCNRGLDEEQKQSIQRQIGLAQESPVEFSNDDKSKLESLTYYKSRLSRHINNNIKDIISHLEDQLDKNIVEISDAKGKIEEIESHIGQSTNEDNVFSAKAKHDNIVATITHIHKVIHQLEESIQETEASISGISKKLSSMSTGYEMDVMSEKIRLVEKIKDIFEKGVSRYRDLLKMKVELDATMLFRQISNEPDFAKLQINDNYGLSILYSDDKKNENRSAGYEHIVAISLIGALQKNAPIQGPVVMDSPFGRLDQIHSSRISAALERLSHQVILLVYEGEIDMQMARETLGSRLTSEYSLSRVSGKQTQIVRV